MRILPTILLGICLVFSSDGNGQFERDTSDVTQGFIVGLTDNTQPERVHFQWTHIYGQPLQGTFKSLVPDLNIWQFNPKSGEFKSDWLEELSTITYAYVNKRVSLRGSIPDDPEYGEQWHMDIIEAPEVWDLTTGGRMADDTEIVVAVFDGGCDIIHEDLAGQIWVNELEIPNDNIDNDNNGYIDDYFGWNAIEESDAHPMSSHGTAVCGLVGAKGNNGLGITGVNWNVKLMVLSGAEGFESQVLAGYNYIYEMRKAWNDSNGTKGAFVVASNSSFGIEYFRGGTPENHPGWCSMYDLLGSAGILNAGATINEGVDVDEVGDIPSACDSDYLITVTNTNREDRKVPNAGYGVTSIDLGAPGDDSWSTAVFDEYDGFGGTSGATPHVAGAIGLLYSIPSAIFVQGARQSPAATALLVKEILIETVDTLSTLESRTLSRGRLNLHRALIRLAGEIGNETGQAIIQTIRPNPANEFVTIDFLFEDYETDIPLRIYATTGQLVHAEDIRFPYFGEPSVTVNTSAWAPGVYYITLTVRNDFISRRFVVH